MELKKVLPATLLLVILAIALTLYFQSGKTEKIVIFHAGSLSVPIAEVSGEFKKNSRN